jgi:hypothetical protein
LPGKNWIWQRNSEAGQKHRLQKFLADIDLHSYHVIGSNFITLTIVTVDGVNMSEYILSVFCCIIIFFMNLCVVVTSLFRHAE